MQITQALFGLLLLSLSHYSDAAGPIKPIISTSLSKLAPKVQKQIIRSPFVTPPTSETAEYKHSLQAISNEYCSERDMKRAFKKIFQYSMKYLEFPSSKDQYDFYRGMFAYCHSKPPTPLYKVFRSFKEAGLNELGKFINIRNSQQTGTIAYLKYACPKDFYKIMNHLEPKQLDEAFISALLPLIVAEGLKGHHMETSLKGKEIRRIRYLIEGFLNHRTKGALSLDAFLGEEMKTLLSYHQTPPHRVKLPVQFPALYHLTLKKSTTARKLLTEGNYEELMTASKNGVIFYDLYPLNSGDRFTTICSYSVLEELDMNPHLNACERYRLISTWAPTLLQLPRACIFLPAENLMSIRTMALDNNWCRNMAIAPDFEELEKRENNEGVLHREIYFNYLSERRESWKSTTDSICPVIEIEKALHRLNKMQSLVTINYTPLCEMVSKCRNMNVDILDYSGKNIKIADLTTNWCSMDMMKDSQLDLYFAYLKRKTLPVNLGLLQKCLTTYRSENKWRCSALESFPYSPLPNSSSFATFIQKEVFASDQYLSFQKLYKMGLNFAFLLKDRKTYLSQKIGGKILAYLITDGDFVEAIESLNSEEAHEALKDLLVSVTTNLPSFGQYTFFRALKTRLLLITNTTADSHADSNTETAKKSDHSMSEFEYRQKLWNDAFPTLDVKALEVALDNTYKGLSGDVNPLKLLVSSLNTEY